MNSNKFSELTRSILNHQPFNLFWSCLPSLLIRDSLIFSYHNCLDQIRFFGRLRQIEGTLTFLAIIEKTISCIKSTTVSLSTHSSSSIYLFRSSNSVSKDFTSLSNLFTSFLKCCVRNDSFPIVSLVLYFHQKVHYTPLHFVCLVQMPGLISLYI